MTKFRPFSTAEVLQLSKSHRVIPIVDSVFADSETPLTIFQKLAERNPGSFLLESAEQGVWARFSFIGVQVRGSLVQEADRSIHWNSDVSDSPLPKDTPQSIGHDFLDALKLVQSSWKSESPLVDIPLTSGLVGAIGWDVIRDLESIPAAKPSVQDTPRAHFAMIQDLVVVDHQTSELLIIANIFVEGQSEPELESERLAALQRIASLKLKLAESSKPFIAEVDFNQPESASANQSKEDFLGAVELAKGHVRKGDVFQVVLSQCFSTETQASPLDVYRILRSLNPSPYMYLLNARDAKGDFAVVGSSPESLVTVNGEAVVTHPIAGSRPRGRDWEEDHSHETSLLADQKEIAEHLMLVDLARNDLLKVCVPSSVAVTEFMQVHRFSHIMHLVSTVEGNLVPGLTPIDVFRATFPAGTLSGAPKPKALEIITNLEPTSRGIYGGVCGYFDFAGNSDLAIAIRTAVIRDGLATVQAGAGIVLDSDPVNEYEETRSKARAVLRAITAANSLKRIG